MIGKLFKSIFRGKAEDESLPMRYDSAVGNPPAVRSPDGAAAEGRRQWITNPWHAVGIVPCAGSCAAAHRAANVRYLSSEAPALPLAGCVSNRKCACRYRHFQDRRGSPRRDSDIIGPRMGWPGRERRIAQGRRGTDGV